MVEVIDYQDIYSERIDSEEANYWGFWDKTSIRNAKEEYDIIKIILKDREYAGHLYGKFIGDLFYFDVILIKEEYRLQGLASQLLKILMLELQKMGCKNIITTAEYKNDIITLEPLLIKFSFEKIIDINGFWGSIYPKVYCNECKSLPCKCKAAVFLKKL